MCSLAVKEVRHSSLKIVPKLLLQYRQAFYFVNKIRHVNFEE
jgi:hypothetical protein